jgi:hypothetical protein
MADLHLRIADSSSSSRLLSCRTGLASNAVRHDQDCASYPAKRQAKPLTVAMPSHTSRQSFT